MSRKVSAESMMDAAARCNLKRIRELLEAGVGPQHLATKRANAITEACFGWCGGWEKQEAARLAVVRELVSAGCPVEGQALFRPVEKGELTLVRFLVEHGADVNAVAVKEYYTFVEKGCTPLSVAIQTGQKDFVAELIQRGASVNQPTTTTLRFGTKFRSSPIINAASFNQHEIIRLLADAGADLNVVDADNYYGTALLTAIALDHDASVAELVAAGADVNLAAGRDGWLPLALAKEKKNASSIKILENAAAGVAKPFEKKEELGKAAESGDLRCVRQLIAGGADVNATCSFAGSDTTALMLAAKNGHAKVVKELLEAGAKHDAATVRGAPALFYAASNGHTDVVRSLLAAGAEVDVQVREAYEGIVTPLVMAAEGGHLEAVEALIAGGANVRHRARSGKTALSSAAAEGHTNVVRVLIDAIGKTKNAGRVFDTPLWWAVYSRHEQVVELLLAAGADPQATGMYEGRSVRVIDMARKNRKSPVFRLLQEAQDASAAAQ